MRVETVIPIDIPATELASFCERHRISRLSLFGSVLTDAFRGDSDVDMLVEFQPGASPGLLGFAEMELELTSLLGRQVDLNTLMSLSPQFREEVRAGEFVVYTWVVPALFGRSRIIGDELDSPANVARSVS